MIGSIRNEVSSWYMRLILIILVLSFVTFYGWSGSSSIGAGNVVKVNSEVLAAKDFQLRYQNALQYYQSQGIDASSEQYQNLIESMVIGSFVDERVKFLEAKRIGFVPSDYEVSQAIRESFSDAEGNFDFDFYKNFVRNRMGKTPSIYEREEAKRQTAISFDQWLSTNIIQSPLALKESYIINNTKRDVSFVKLSKQNTQNKLPSISQPTEDEVQAYYEEFPSEFMSPERRKLEILSISKKDFANLDQEAFLKQADDTFSLVANDQSMDFKEYAQKQESIHYLDTNWISYSDTLKTIASEDQSMILNASLALELEQNTQSLRARSGETVYLAKLKGVQSPQVEPLEVAKEKIKSLLYQAKQQEQLFAFAQKTHQQWVSSNQSIETLASQNNWSVEKTGLFAQHPDAQIPELGEQPELHAAIFKKDIKKESWIPNLYKVNQDYVIAIVSDHQEPDMDQFESKKMDLWTVSSQNLAAERMMTFDELARKNVTIIQARLN